ncbi:MAG: multidrug efflux SMR transporter [Verrucomicrobia bacterium]|nr:multidrug efflux SMR transporter [Verrucomicrobiota bacterium]
MQWLYLSIAILAEVIATSSLKAAEGFTRLIPSLIVVFGYGTAFYFLSLTLRTMQVGTAYAIWSGVGTVIISIVAWLLYNQKLDAPSILGMALIISGVIIIKFLSPQG